MAKLGWAISGLLVAAFILVAAAPAGDDQVLQKLEELKAISTESLRLQKIDMHRRLFPEHHLKAKCDLDSDCAATDNAIRAHGRAYRHPWAEDCSMAVCLSKEKSFSETMDLIAAKQKAEDAARGKENHETILRRSWLVGVSEVEFNDWVKRYGNTISPEDIEFLKAYRAEKVKGK